MGGKLICPKCGSRDTHYFMMMPVGTFHCYSCYHNWMPGVEVEEEPYIKYGKDVLVDFEADAAIQFGYHFDPHIQFFAMLEGKVCSVEMFWDGFGYMLRQMGAIA